MMRNLSRAFVSICLRMLTAVGIATSSVVGDAVYDNEIGWTPQPTGAMGLPFHDWLNKRQNDAPTSVCGYIASDNTLTCSSEYCGFNTASGAFGCCQSLVTTGPSTALTACAFFSACNDYTFGCNDLCSLDTGLQACTDTASPYCVLYERVGDGFTLTNWGCTVTSGLTVQISASLTAPASVVPSTTSTTISAQPSSTSVQIYSTTPSLPAPTVSSTSTSESIESSTPFSQSQPSASNGVPVVTVTADGLKQIPSLYMLSLIWVLQLAFAWG